MQRILLIGSSGQLGHDLARRLGGMGDCIGLTRADADLADHDCLRKSIRETAPSLIVNAAAYTSVERAEIEPQLAFLVNQSAVGAIGEEARALGSFVIHFSTDYVFDGKGCAPYSESDVPAPANTYGASKLGGETALLESGARCLIFRVAWLYSAFGNNFVKTILSKARKDSELRVVQDQFGCPTWTGEIACAVATVAGLVLSKAPIAKSSGVYHLAGSGYTDWRTFAERVVDRARIKWGTKFPLAVKQVVGISSAELVSAVRRPAWSVLSSAKMQQDFGITLRSWEVQLDAFFASLPDPAYLLDGES
jgi:dTDP-4-dehydrorhamnose reductase